MAQKSFQRKSTELDNQRAGRNPRTVNNHPKTQNSIGEDSEWNLSTLPGQKGNQSNKSDFRSERNAFGKTGQIPRKSLRKI